LRFRQLALLLAFVATVSACSREGAPQSAQVAEAPTSEAVVVYAAYDDKTYLPALFNEFTQKTGTVVIVRNGEVPGIVDDVILKRTTPPADVLITPSVAGAWRVAEESELRPNYSTAVASLPEWFRDPDKYWAALGYRAAVIVFDPRQIDAAELGSYEDLADTALRRKLCLTSSQRAINRAVIAMLVEKLGKREAELAVRGWVANLAREVFDTDAALLQAINSGECAVGIASSGAIAGTRLGVHRPAVTYFDIEAIGITRHARNPEAAAALIDWLLSPDIQARHAAQTGGLPVTESGAPMHSIVLVAAGLEEAAKLAERARYH
jgi:iron(III) transport system substrate-binding protein